MKQFTKIFVIIGAFLTGLVLLVLISSLITPIDPVAAAEKYKLAANNYFEKKQYPEAVANYTKAISFQPKDARLYELRSIAHIRQKHYALGAKDFAKAANLDPRGKIGKHSYAMLKELRDGVKMMENGKAMMVAGNFMDKWPKYFDEATACVNRQDYVTARNLHLLALSSAISARNADPANTNNYAAIYFIKGYMYFISGSNYVKAIKPNFDNYSLLVMLRKAYYPLKCAQLYYKEALQYCTIPALKKIMEAAVKTDNFYLDSSSKKWLASVDSKGRVFMKNIDSEAQVTVNFDIINDKLATKDFKAAASLIDKNAELINELRVDETTNAMGLVKMQNAYTKLYWALYRMNEDPRIYRSAIRNNLDACIGDLRNAQTGFRNTSLAAAAGELEKYATELLNNVG